MSLELSLAVGTDRWQAEVGQIAAAAAPILRTPRRRSRPWSFRTACWLDLHFRTCACLDSRARRWQLSALDLARQALLSFSTFGKCSVRLGPAGLRLRDRDYQIRKIRDQQPLRSSGPLLSHCIQRVSEATQYNMQDNIFLPASFSVRDRSRRCSDGWLSNHDGPL